MMHRIDTLLSRETLSLLDLFCSIFLLLHPVLPSHKPDIAPLYVPAWILDLKEYVKHDRQSLLAHFKVVYKI